MGYEMDVRAEGNMLFIQNKDVPGVIGKVGMMLGENSINIAEYILSRTSKENSAYSVIKYDGDIGADLLAKLKEIQEILNVKQLNV